MSAQPPKRLRPFQLHVNDVISFGVSSDPRKMMVTSKPIKRPDGAYDVPNNLYGVTTVQANSYLTVTYREPAPTTEEKQSDA